MVSCGTISINDGSDGTSDIILSDTEDKTTGITLYCNTADYQSAPVFYDEKIYTMSEDLYNDLINNYHGDNSPPKSDDSTYSAGGIEMRIDFNDGRAIYYNQSLCYIASDGKYFNDPEEVKKAVEYLNDIFAYADSKTPAKAEIKTDLDGVTLWYRSDSSPYGYGQELSNPDAVARADEFIRTMAESGSGKDKAIEAQNDKVGDWFDIKLSDGREVHENQGVFTIEGMYYTWDDVDKYDPDFRADFKKALAPDTKRLMKEKWDQADDAYRAVNPDPDTLDITAFE